jgi:hypothetical protein
VYKILRLAVLTFIVWYCYTEDIAVRSYPKEPPGGSDCYLFFFRYCNLDHHREQIYILGGSVAVKALSYKQEGLIPDEANFLNLPNPSDLTKPWGLLGS